jgi:hypothetical protein
LDTTGPNLQDYSGLALPNLVHGTIRIRIKPIRQSVPPTAVRQHASHPRTEIEPTTEPTENAELVKSGIRPVRSVSVLQACRIVVSATLFLSAASVLGTPSSWQPPANAVRVDRRIGFDSGLNLCPSAFICGSTGFGCGLRGRARRSVVQYRIQGSQHALDIWLDCGIILTMSLLYGQAVEVKTQTEKRPGCASVSRLVSWVCMRLTLTWSVAAEPRTEAWFDRRGSL